MGMFDDFSSAALAPSKPKPAAASMASQVAFSPEDAAHADATNKAYPDDGFAQAYAKASPADRADLLRSRTMKIATSSNIPDDFSSANLSAPAAVAAPANQSAPAQKPFNPNDISSAEGGFSDMGRLLAHGATAIGSSIYGGLRALGTLATGGSINDATSQIEDAQQKYTYNPPAGSSSANALGLAGAKYSPLTLLNKGTGSLGDKTLAATGSPILATLADVGTNAAAQVGVGKLVGKALSPAVAAKTPTAPMPRVEPTMDGALPTPQPVQPLTTGAVPQPVPAQQAQAGVPPVAAQAPSVPRPTVADTTPEMQQALEGADPADPVAQRHIDADSLPVPVKLTKGQATLDPMAISDEMNGRGKVKPTVSPDFYNAQGKALAGNIDAMRDKVAPDLDPQQMTPYALGQKLVDSYKAMDTPIQADITAKYKALEDANGGQFPIDGQALAANTQAALDKALKAGSVPADLQANLNQFANGRQMTFQDFETMRSDAADAQRTATDGRQRAAAGIVREQLENMPLTPEAAALKPLADQARAAAKARFDALDADPAYKAAVTDGVGHGEPSPVADKFVNSYLVNGKYANVRNMTSNLASDPAALQAISAAGVEYLRGAGKVDSSTGNFTSAGYNKAVDSLGPKLDVMLGPETAAIARRVGSTAKLAQAQPRGSFVNNSNTLVGAAGQVGMDLFKNALAVKTYGASKVVGGLIDSAKAGKAAKAAVSPGAGVTRLSDLAPPAD